MAFSMAMRSTPGEEVAAPAVAQTELPEAWIREALLSVGERAEWTWDAAARDRVPSRQTETRGRQLGAKARVSGWLRFLAAGTLTLTLSGCGQSSHQASTSGLGSASATTPGVMSPSNSGVLVAAPSVGEESGRIPSGYLLTAADLPTGTTISDVQHSAGLLVASSNDACAVHHFSGTSRATETLTAQLPDGAGVQEQLSLMSDAAAASSAALMASDLPCGVAGVTLSAAKLATAGLRPGATASAVTGAGPGFVVVTESAGSVFMVLSVSSADDAETALAAARSVSSRM